MNIEMFMTQMNGEHKDAVVQKHIIRQYVPLEEKIAEAKKIVELACYKDVVDANGKVQKMYWVDTPKKFFLTFLAYLRMYTDLTVSETESLKEYNMLVEKKYDRKILAALPAEDAVIFDNILDMVWDDEDENVNSIEGRIKNFIFGFDGVLQQALIQIADNTIEGEENNGMESRVEGDIGN